MVADNNKDIMNINDPLDINELAALNDDISAEFIEQLQNQISQNAGLTEKAKDQDITTIFEEVNNKNETKNLDTDKEDTQENNTAAKLDENIDDNFIKKYKAKIEKEENPTVEETKNIGNKTNIPTIDINTQVNNDEIETLTNGNIVERPATNAQIEYNDSLDLLDDNVKYSKYVIYIDPENIEFIESLTVKERKNLINRILKEQDNIVITQKRLNSVQTYIKHIIIAILTIAIATPIIYFTINASLEATINNHRRSQTIFKTLYKEKGKIKNNRY